MISATPVYFDAPFIIILEIARPPPPPPPPPPVYYERESIWTNFKER